MSNLTGNQALARAAAIAGCGFFATHRALVTAALFDELDVALRGRHGRCTRTAHAAEAATNAFEAAKAGAKVLVATAGLTLASCGEAIGRAQLSEVPLVLVHCQHLGDADAPIVGDVDVGLARHLAPGSVPLPVFAATDAASTFHLALRAFEIAGKLRTPVLLLTSKEIAMTAEAVDPGETNPPTWSNDPGDTAGFKKAFNAPSQPFSPEPGAGDEDERALAGGEPARLREKLARKADLPELVAVDPDPDAQTLLAAYGVADQAARRAVKLVRAAGGRVSHLTVYSLWPMPRQALRRALTPYVCRVLVPELNAGLYADELLRLVKGVKIEPLARYDGRLIEPEAIARRITDWPCG